MDFEKRARRQSFRVIISETIMVLTVIIMVAVLALVVSGYWVNADFQVERQGMLQVNSVPTGASVAVDGDAPWYQRTNTSKVLSSGEHHIVLTRDGYDTWEKTINITEGLLYRLQYPRLFLLERERESVYDAAKITFASISGDRNTMLLASTTTTWNIINLENDKLEPKSLDVSPYFSLVSLAEGATTGLFTGEITSIQWSGDNTRVLIEATATAAADETPVAGITEWVLLDLKTPKNSINLTREFATTFTEMRIFDNSANSLLALRSGNLHKIDVSARQISSALVRDVNFYDFYSQDIIFVTNKYLGTIRPGDSEPTIIKDFSRPAISDATPASSEVAIIATAPVSLIPATVDATTRAYLSRFYDTKYLTIITGGQISVYRQDDYSEVLSAETDFTPTIVKVGQSGDFVFLNSGTMVATLDMESQSLISWELDSANYHWLDNNMLYTIASGNLVVYDYDGYNRRALATNVSSHFPAGITKNRWLYYFSDDEIIRETIAR